mmetsp:Transcript_114973/g.359731  ORF Transcript_114973/g.359731 Transcript_114973/m.359731 type:complete len:251 (+) Transcript_114973:94-846(+)
MAPSRGFCANGRRPGGSSQSPGMLWMERCMFPAETEAKIPPRHGIDPSAVGNSRGSKCAPSSSPSCTMGAPLLEPAPLRRPLLPEATTGSERRQPALNGSTVPSSSSAASVASATSPLLRLKGGLTWTSGRRMPPPRGAGGGQAAPPGALASIIAPVGRRLQPPGASSMERATGGRSPLTPRGETTMGTRGGAPAKGPGSLGASTGSCGGGMVTPRMAAARLALCVARVCCSCSRCIFLHCSMKDPSLAN